MTEEIPVYFGPASVLFELTQEAANDAVFEAAEDFLIALLLTNDPVPDHLVDPINTLAASVNLANGYSPEEEPTQ